MKQYSPSFPINKSISYYKLSKSLRASELLPDRLSKETAPVIKDITINVLTYKLFITIDRSRSLISLPPIDHATSAATVSEWTGTRRPTDRLTDTERRFGISLCTCRDVTNGYRKE
ncbi:hypothetical protein EVAR_21776_1 [Eumeta japonica]|uniref:Uncharacterized protein n=1 Tax=Eumeta variegata TaxID=151549 RepID=A0A4C1SNE1_EUMVA|nr:hypothetical protein EVAR_21776_1 [Eumeta japonica]